MFFFNRELLSKIFLVCGLATILSLPSITLAQILVDDNGNPIGGGAPEPEPVGGVLISAEGLLARRSPPRQPGQLNAQRFNAAKANLNSDVQRVSALRKVSLNRLEAEVAKLISNGKPVPAEARYLAGLTKITHVFFYPDSKDIVIAGPAEGFFFSADNFVVGMKSGRATLKLEDLVVALRAFGPELNKVSSITCSIDPTQSGIVRLKKAVKQWQNLANAQQFGPGMENQAVQSFKEALGLQTIKVAGISPETDFARILVEADYRMKLVGLGLEQPAVPGVTPFVAKATPASASKLQRWFFQPDYNCVTINNDGTAMEIAGTGVKLLGEAETANANGERKGTGRSSSASLAFTNSFTKTYAKLADKTPIWAELRNIIDLSITAAFIQKMDLYRKADWTLGVFEQEYLFPVETCTAATKVAPIANAFWKDGRFMSPIAGGVHIQAMHALNSDNAKVDTSGKLDEVRNQTQLSDLKHGQWWWD